MSTFRFNAKVQDPFSDITDAALGTSGQGWGNEEVGKAVKLSSANNYVLATNGDEIEGFVVSVEPNTVNGGASFGSVQRNGRMLAKLASGVTGAAVGNFVVAAAQEAVGTQVNSNLALVKPGTAASQLGSGAYTYTVRTPNSFMWRIIRLLTDGEAGSTVLLERI